MPIKIEFEAFKRLDFCETLKKLTADYGVAKVNVGDWHRNRDKIENF